MEFFKEGNTFYLPKPNKTKCHVVTVVDNNMVVYKWFGKHKQWWHYGVESASYLKSMHGIVLDRENKEEYIQ